MDLLSECVVDLVMVIDDSGSIRDNNMPGQTDNYDRMKTFASALVDRLNIGQSASRVGVVTFSNEAITRLYLGDYFDKPSIKRVITDLPYTGGNTNTTGALRVARQEVLLNSRGDRPSAKNVILLITDGEPTREVNGLDNEVNTVKASQTQIIGVGISNVVNEVRMRSLVSQPSFYVPVESFSGLQDVANTVSSLICTAARS